MSNTNITPFYSKGYENAEVKTISSTEVAEMMGKGHAELLRDIDGRDNHVGIIPTLEKANLALSNYFIPSTYKAGTREYKCYLVTKMGCELLGNKQQGEKGILFTAKYVERFNQMEQVLHNPYANLSPELQMLIKLEQGQTELNQRIGDLENNMTIDYSQQEALRLAISTRVYQLLGNAKENVKLRSKVYSNLHRCIKKQFSVNSYKNIAVKEFENAKAMITVWMPDEIMTLAIQGAKSQMSLM